MSVLQVDDPGGAGARRAVAIRAAASRGAAQTKRPGHQTRAREAARIGEQRHPVKFHHKPKIKTKLTELLIFAGCRRPSAGPKVSRKR